MSVSLSHHVSLLTSYISLPILSCQPPAVPCQSLSCHVSLLTLSYQPLLTCQPPITSCQSAYLMSVSLSCHVSLISSCQSPDLAMSPCQSLYLVMSASYCIISAAFSPLVIIPASLISFLGGVHTNHTAAEPIHWWLLEDGNHCWQSQHRQDLCGLHSAPHHQRLSLRLPQRGARWRLRVWSQCR